MAGKAKHMERSHRSYSNNNSIYKDFSVRAVAKMAAKTQKENAGLLSKLMSSLKQKVRKQQVK